MSPSLAQTAIASRAVAQPSGAQPDRSARLSLAARSRRQTIRFRDGDPITKRASAHFWRADAGGGLLLASSPRATSGERLGTG